MQNNSNSPPAQLLSQTQSQHFAQLLNGMPIVAFSVDQQGRITYLNDTAAAILQAEKMPAIELGCTLESCSINPFPALINLVNKVIADGIERSEDIELVLPVHKLALSVTLRAKFDDANTVHEVAVIGTEQAGAEPAIASVSSAVKSWQSLFSRLKLYGWTYYFATDTIAMTPLCHQDLDLPEDASRRISFEQFVDIIHPDDRALIRERYRAFLNNPQGPRLKQEFRLRDQRGDYIWVQDKLSLQLDADNHSQYAVGIFEDITDDIAQNDTMQKNADRLDLALDLIHGALWDFDAKENGFFVDDRFSTLLGQLPDKFFHTKRWIEHIHPEDRSRVIRISANLSRDDPKVAYQYRLKMDNGEYFYAMNICLATHFEQSGAPKRITGVLYDYSAISLAQRQLAISEERLSLALEAANEGVWEYFPQQDRSFRSDSYLKLLGINTVTNEEPSMLPDAVHPDIHPDDLERYTQTVANLVEGICDEMSLEVRVIHQQGHTIFVDNRCRVIERSSDGQALRIVGIAKDVSDRVAQQKEIEALAYYDVLTGLPNRRLVLDRAHQALERETRLLNPVTLMILDLDKFKEVNDTLGHQAGDQVLVELSKRFQTCMRASDTLGRQGGDEFIIVLPACDEEQAYRVAKRIITQVQQPVVIDDKEVSCGVSIGIAITRENNTTIDELLRKADIAMYRAKSSDTSIAWFDAAYAVEMAHRIKLEQDLRVAIKEASFTVVYQPRVSLDSGTIISLEALMRWQHPEFGVVCAAEFIPIAEESGLIVELGRALIDKVCRQQLQWRRAGIETTVSINASPGELINDHYAQHLLETMVSFDLPAVAIEVELTETAAISNWEQVITTLNRLDRANIIISLDDWGTGNSSLSYLTRIPAHYVKLDRTFIEYLDHSDPKKNTQLILRGMTALTHSLGFKLVAEGIETVDQALAVKELGCNQGQGYLFSPPLSPNKVTPLLQQQHITLPF